jgi:hypothetical protein
MDAGGPIVAISAIASVPSVYLIKNRRVVAILKMLISIKELVMKLIKLLFISICMLFATSAVANDAALLRATTEYVFVGGDGIFDTEGRLLAWEGTTSGDIEGIIRWWLFMPTRVTGQASHFAGRWEIWDDTDPVLLLAGYEAGTTTDRPGKNGVWRANGIVTYVNPDFLEVDDWFGRQVHDGGEFEWVIPGVFPLQGWGKFRIN